MDAQQQLTFLQERIEEIGSAIFHNQSDAVLKLPTSIVNSVKADDYGFVWFVLEKPTQQLTEFEQEFPVKMDFYKKGVGCFLQVAGHGFVVTDPEEINSYRSFPDTAQLSLTDGVLMKVKIHNASYYETRSGQKTSWWQTAMSAVMAWFRHEPYRDGNIYFPAS